MISSPCINRCSYNEILQFCFGCGRSLSEVASWKYYNEAEREKISDIAKTRLEWYNTQQKSERK